MPRKLGLTLALAATALVVAIPATATADGPSASASRNCPMSYNQQKNGFPPASYVTSIRVFGTSWRNSGVTPSRVTSQISSLSMSPRRSRWKR